MTITVTPSQDNIQLALWTFLTGIMAIGMEIVRGQVNRVPEPRAGNYIVFWPIGLPRLATNEDTYEDVLFEASIAGTTMTVTAVTHGVIAVGATVFGVGIADNTIITALGSGIGGTGTYVVGVSQTLAARALSAGNQRKMQPTQVNYQLDVHGPQSHDNAQIIATMMRDEYAVLKFAESGFDVTPLYAKDPLQMPFDNGEQQYEDRWIVEVALQSNAAVIVPQQFADGVDVALVPVP